MNMSRSAGILLHITSLPGRFGIGDLGPAAHSFLDWLAEAGARWWQVLPLGPTGYGDSPYAPLSSFAGNTLLVSPELLERDGLLTKAELAAAASPETGQVDYRRVSEAKAALLLLAARRFLDDAGTAERAAFTAFKRENDFWLRDYLLFSDIKEHYDHEAAASGGANSSWNLYWPKDLARRDEAALSSWAAKRERSLDLRAAEQFFFCKQWMELRELAAGRGIGFIGDLPIFVAMDSADTWARPGLFDLDENLRPREVAGVPPDYFSEDGQLWGNPLYAWDAHVDEGFAWWLSRVESALNLFDQVRIDHFRGLEAYWAVPGGASTARVGTWRKAPGRAFLSALAARVGEKPPIIAEDLGYITDEVRALLSEFGLPGMRILQFAFDSRESGTLDPGNPFLPHHYPAACAVYTGTHDNEPLSARLAGMNDTELAYLYEYLGYKPADPVGALVREALKSPADLAVLPMQDVLGLGPESRMNLPGSLGGNWAFRLRTGQPDKPSAARLAAMNRIYSRR